MSSIASLFRKLTLPALLLLTCGFISAQDTGEGETPSIETILQSADGIAKELEIQVHPSAAPSSNEAYIHQIGTDNMSAIQVSTKNSELNLMQHGNANRADVNVSGESLTHTTLQNGNGNVLMEYGNTANLNLERNILQDGNNQNLIIYGSNSLTEKLKVSVQGNAETITIRNFN